MSEADQSVIKKKRGAFYSFKRILLNFDVEAAPFNFYLPDGNTTFMTTTGGISFLIFATLFGTYIIAGLISFVDRTQYNVLESIAEDVVIGKENSFGREQNFAVAARLTGPNINVIDDIESKDIGQLKFYMKLYEENTIDF